MGSEHRRCSGPRPRSATARRVPRCSRPPARPDNPPGPDPTRGHSQRFQGTDPAPPSWSGSRGQRTPVCRGRRSHLRREARAPSRHRVDRQHAPGARLEPVHAGPPSAPGPVPSSIHRVLRGTAARRAHDLVEQRVAHDDDDSRRPRSPARERRHAAALEREAHRVGVLERGDPVEGRSARRPSCRARGRRPGPRAASRRPPRPAGGQAVTPTTTRTAASDAGDGSPGGRPVGSTTACGDARQPDGRQRRARSGPGGCGSGRWAGRGSPSRGSARTARAATTQATNPPRSQRAGPGVHAVVPVARVAGAPRSPNRTTAIRATTSETSHAVRDHARERPRDRPQADGDDPPERPARRLAAATGEVGEDRARLLEVVPELVGEERQVARRDDRDGAEPAPERRPAAGRVPGAAVARRGPPPMPRRAAARITTPRMWSCIVPIAPSAREQPTSAPGPTGAPGRPRRTRAPRTGGSGSGSR